MLLFFCFFLGLWGEPFWVNFRLLLYRKTNTLFKNWKTCLYFVVDMARGSGGCYNPFYYHSILSAYKLGKVFLNFGGKLSKILGAAYIFVFFVAANGFSFSHVQYNFHAKPLCIWSVSVMKSVFPLPFPPPETTAATTSSITTYHRFITPLSYSCNCHRIETLKCPVHGWRTS